MFLGHLEGIVKLTGVRVLSRPGSRRARSQYFPWYRSQFVYCKQAAIRTLKSETTLAIYRALIGKCFGEHVLTAFKGVAV